MLATEDLLQKHALLETEIKAKSERVKALNEKVKKQLPQQVRKQRQTGETTQTDRETDRNRQTSLSDELDLIIDRKF